MDSFFKFASESPVLTFFLVCVIAECIVRSVQALCGGCDCDCEDEDED